MVDAARNGDADALDTLLHRHYDRLHAVCRRITGNDADAADACQEALIAIARGLPRFDAHAAFGTWAYRVTTNACLDELRRRTRRPAPGLPDHGGPVVASAEGAVAARLDVDAALAQLPEDFRVAVVLRDLAGLDYAGIAEILDVPVGTVRSRIARGRAALVPLLADAGNPPAPADRPTP